MRLSTVAQNSLELKDVIDEGLSNVSKDNNLLSCLRAEATIDATQNLAQCMNIMESNHSVDAAACSEIDATLQPLEISD